MTYKDLYEKAEEKLEKGEITCGEFDELTKPLDEEIRPHGEWIEYKLAEKVEGRLISNYECSCCHSWKRENTDFCPNCGASMRKEGKRNEVCR